MSVRKTLLAVAATSFALAGCATTTTPLPASLGLSGAAREKIASTDIVMPIPQKEIFFYDQPVAGAGATYMPVYTPVSTGMSTGAAATVGIVGILLVAGIAAAQAADEASDLKPLRDAMDKFAFDETLRTEMKAAVAQTPWIKATEPKVLKQPKPEEVTAAVASSAASGVMMVNTSYTINSNADEITMAITPAFYAASPDLKALTPAAQAAAQASANSKSKSSAKPKPVSSTDPGNRLYYNTFTFRTQVSNAVTGRREANIAAWTANDAAALKAAMSMGSAKLAQMLVSDLEAPSGPVDPKTTTLRPINAELVNGHVLRADAEGQVVLLAAGGQVYLANAALEPLTKAGPATAEEAAASGKKMSGRERAKLQKEEEKARKAAAKQKN
ncbi:MAG TPA: hypothetical protein VGO52_14290 [Hyphomonadaceae bacterium]|jgi:hypothetical protein|nr:hypothetical protein [Hyphomonadaceae bacterium]